MRRRILLVDDQFPTRQILRFNLEQAGFQVVVAADGEEAWSALNRVPIDLVLTDVAMPRLSGNGLCEMVRSETALATIPLVLFTAQEPPLEPAKLAALGVAHYFRKPFSVAEIVAKVSELLSDGAATSLSRLPYAALIAR